jgi:hypothetical protein
VIQETACRYNLGELLIWLDRLDAAAATARHAFDLCVRHDPTPIPHVGVLCARVAVARGRFAEAREHLAWVDARWAPCDLPADIAIFRRAALAAIDAAPPAAWREIIDGSSGMTANEQLEVLAAAIASTDDADLRAAARVLASGDPVWAARFDKS